MKISELITKLKEAQEKYGDIESRTFEMTDYSGGEFLPIVQVEYCKADDYDPEFIIIGGFVPKVVPKPRKPLREALKKRRK